MSLTLEDKTFLAIIPARGGSKRLANKNILDLGGKPLISWTIEASLKSRYINTTLVTSDSQEILSIAKQDKAHTIKRPSELASDTSTSFEAIKHAIENTQKHDYVILLQPTSPLRSYKHIDEAIELLKAKNADAIISVCETEHSPLWSNTLPQDGSLKAFLNTELINKRSQDLEKYYRLNGAIYICKTDKLLQNSSFFIQDKIYSYLMPKTDSIDIDEELDFDIANFLITKKVNNGIN